MNFIKKLLYVILGLLSLISLFIIICAFQPELSGQVSDWLYKSDRYPEENSDINTDSAVQPASDMDAADSAGVQAVNFPQTTADDINGGRKNESSYVPPEKSAVNVPEELSGRGGYVPVRDDNEQVDEEEARKLREKYTYGETGDGLTFDTEYYPYYGMLDDKQQRLYRQIYANAMAVNGIFNPIEEVTPSQLRNVFMAVFNDHPELFWLDSAYQGRFAGNGICVEIVLQFYELVDDLESAKNEFQGKAEEILAGARGAGSDYEKEVYVHNALLDRIEYDLQAPFNQSAYSALVNGRTVCAGYARAMQYLMTQLGVPCYYCTGYAGENHAWNIIKLDGEYYNVDATWDDTNPNTYDYFNKSDEDFASTHRREDLSVYLPACNGSRYSNLESNPPADEYQDDTEYLRSLEDTGLNEENVLWSLEDYYNDCYSQIMAIGGSGQFQNVVDSEELWMQCYRAYNSDAYSSGYMDRVLSELNASGCEVNVEAEPLKGGRFLLRHSISFF